MGRPARLPAPPADLTALLAGRRWHRVDEGESGAAVFRLVSTGTAPDLYLKTAAGERARHLADEAARLRWLGGHLPTAAVRAFAQAEDRAWLVTAAVPGCSLAEALEGAAPAARPALVESLAAFLRRLQAIAPSACPFTADPSLRLGQARARIDAGLVDPADFDDERQGWTPEQVWDALLAARPGAIEPVVSHGDFTPENVFCHDGAVSGCLDAGRLGIADRYHDIALAWRGLAAFGPALQAQFLMAMGAAPADPARLAFPLLLDELF